MRSLVFFCAISIVFGKMRVCPVSQHYNPKKDICEGNVCNENVSCKYGSHWEFHLCKCVSNKCVPGIACMVADSSKNFIGRHIDYSLYTKDGKCMFCVDDCPQTRKCSSGMHWSRRDCGCIVDCYSYRECRKIGENNRYWDTEYCSCECDNECYPLNPTTCTCPSL